MVIVIKKSFEENLIIVDATLQKMAEVGPHNHGLLVRWLMEQYNLTRTTAQNMLKRAQEASRTLYAKDTKELVSDMVMVLDAIIYKPTATDKSKIEATKTKANLLGLWRVNVSNLSAQILPMTPEELLETTILEHGKNI